MLKTCFLLALVLFAPASGYGWADWKCLKNEYYKVFYKPQYENQAYELFYMFDYIRPEIERFTGAGIGHLPVTLEDKGMVVNGLSHPVFNFIRLNTTPPLGGNLSYTRNWFSAVGAHELTHIYHLTKTEGLPEVLSSIFGNIFTPNLTSPLWIIEGSPVYAESMVFPNQGRLNDGYFHAYIEARHSAGRFPDIMTATAQPLEYPLGAAYLYGGMFWEYLAGKYGAERFSAFYAANGSSVLSLLSPILPCIGIDRASKQTFGKSLPELWAEWKSEQEAKGHYSRESRKLTERGWRIEDIEYENGKIYASRSYRKKTGPYSHFSINELSEYDPLTNSERTLFLSTAPWSLNLDINGDELYYAVVETKRGFDNASNLTFGTYHAIRRRNLQTGSDDAVLKGAIRAFTALPDSSILYSEDIKGEFGSNLFSYENGAKHFHFRSDCLINEIETDGERIVVQARKEWENYNLYELDLTNQKLKPLVKTPYWTGDISLFEDRLYFSSNRGKEYRIFYYDFATEEIFESESEEYRRNPHFDKTKEKLYFTGLNSYGEDIYSAGIQFEETAFDETLPAAPQFTKTEGIRKGSYWDNLAALAPKLRFPIIYTDEDSAAVGVVLAGADAVGDFPMYITSFQYDYKRQKPNYSLELQFNYFAPLYGSISYTDFDEGTLRAAVRYPFLVRQSAGLQNVSIGLSSNRFDDFQRHLIQQDISLRFGFPFTEFRCDFALLTESETLGSTLHRTGLYSELNLRQYTGFGELRTRLRHIHDLESPDKAFPILRGCNHESRARKGYFGSLDVHIPMLEIRTGLWNPNIYFEDFIATPFIEYADCHGFDNQYSYGLELHQEVKAFFSCLQLDLGLRFVQNELEEKKVEWFIRTGVL